MYTLLLLLLSLQTIAQTHWVNIWTSMSQLTEPDNLPPVPFNSTFVFENTTIRQTIRLSLDASTIRLRLSNVFGTEYLPVTNVSISFPDGKPGTTVSQPTFRDITFSEDPSIIISPGALTVSDPVYFPVQAKSTLMVNIYLQHGQDRGITSHPGSRTTSWMAKGNWVDSTDLTDSESAEHWYFLSAVEALLPSNTRSFAIIGDSITNGRGSDTNQNNRWPDLLLNRMQQSPNLCLISILNQAAGGNRILHDGLGPSVLSRIDRDVLAQSGVRYAMIFEGVNDIGIANADQQNQTVIGDRLIAAYKQVVVRIHVAGIPVFGATITPFGTPVNSTYVQPYSNPERERSRQRVNQLIRTSGIFDAVVDFDRILRNPTEGPQLKEEYDSGDHLHPNVKGYQALADNFPLTVFTGF